MHFEWFNASLQENNIPYDTVPTVDGIEDAVQEDGAKAELKCTVPIQKETPTGLVDTICQTEVPDKHAGLCR